MYNPGLVFLNVTKHQIKYRIFFGCVHDFFDILYYQKYNKQNTQT